MLYEKPSGWLWNRENCHGCVHLTYKSTSTNVSLFPIHVSLFPIHGPQAKNREYCMVKHQILPGGQALCQIVTQSHNGGQPVPHVARVWMVLVLRPNGAGLQPQEKLHLPQIPSIFLLYYNASLVFELAVLRTD